MSANLPPAGRNDGLPLAGDEPRIVEVTGWLPARVLIDMSGLTLDNGGAPANPRPRQPPGGNVATPTGSRDRKVAQGTPVPVVIPDSPPAQPRHSSPEDAREPLRRTVPADVPPSISVRSSRLRRRELQSLTYVSEGSAKSTASWVEDQLHTPPPPPPTESFIAIETAPPALSTLPSPSHRSRSYAGDRTPSKLPSRAATPALSTTLRSSSLGMPSESSSQIEYDPHGYISESDDGRNGKNAWYVVTKGKRTGVFKRWTNVEHWTSGVSGAAYKGCKNKMAARELYRLALSEGKVKKLSSSS